MCLKTHSRIFAVLVSVSTTLGGCRSGFETINNVVVPDGGDAGGATREDAGFIDAAAPCSAAGTSPLCGWGFRKSITVPRSRVASRLIDFPLLVSFPRDAELARSLGNGAADLRFSAADGLTPLSYEIEEYNSDTGGLVAWVHVPELSAETDTILFLYYGNQAADSAEEPSAVWDGHFKMVSHLSEAPDDGVRGHEDSTVNANHGTPRGFESSAGSTLARGIIGGANEFDGVGTYIEIPSAPSLGLETAGTISAWAQRGSLDAWHTILAKGTENDDVAHNYALRISRDNFIEGVLGNGTMSRGVADFGAPVEDTRTFQYYALTWSVDEMHLYVNGSNVTTMSRSFAPMPNRAPLTIGRFGGASDYFDGVIDEVRVSDVPRAPEWIATQYLNQLNPPDFAVVGPEERL